jgi:hypothetical protein
MDGMRSLPLALGGVLFGWGGLQNGQTTNWTAPVLANGLICCRNSEGDVVCVDVR